MVRIASLSYVERPPVRHAAVPHRLATSILGVARSVVAAISAAHQRQAERDMTRLLARSGGRLTDDIERRATEAFSGARSFTAHR